MTRGFYHPFPATCGGCGSNFRTRIPKIQYRVCSLQCRHDLNILKNGSDECWPWTGLRDEDGYGEFIFKGKKWRAHRAAYHLAKGKIPRGKLIMHSCDNPPCCNPRHLFLGTILANTADMDRKGRRKSANGKLNGNATLTEDNVRFIRKSPLSANILARRFRVKDQCIYKVRQKIHWKHIQP